jgi:adenine-specific DNA-methyltransferase
MSDPASPIPASLNFEKLKAKLRELFELDKADLDFGIYRVLRQRHAEITEFLDKHLEKTVRAALTEHQAFHAGHLEGELQEAIQAARLLKRDPDTFPEVMVIREKLNDKGGIEATADEVYSHLFTFFARYYQGGDFLGLHRSTVHGREKYMIPYNGEEVKLVWANMDQYYIKSSELLRDYSFRIRRADLASGELNLGDWPAESVVRFKLVEGDTEKDNRKPDGKTTRVFALDGDTPFEENGDTLCLRFGYREHASERNLQDKLNADTEQTLADNLPPRWKALLFAADPTHQPKDKKDTRTVLQKHLRGYTAKFLFDYFIHKDLGGFLRRELEFYVKNEVMHLDDIEAITAPKAEEYLSKIRAIRRCALPVIQMIAQLEEFQKKLWLKKKFVVETRYCLTLDRVPEKLYPDICATNAQWQEWDELVALADLKPKRTPEFLKEHPFLMIDTRYFSREFTIKLLASIENLDASLNGICFHSENFQALQLMQERYREQVKCVYIDPPYNTSASSIPYKNDYKDSSWGTLMRDRLERMHRLLTNDGAMFVSIDKHERTILEHVLDDVFHQRNRIEELIWVQNTNDGKSPTYSTNHEYVEVYAKRREPVEADPRMFREPKPGCHDVLELINSLNPHYPPVAEIEKALAKLYEEHKAAYREDIEAQDLDYEEEKRNDPWKGIYAYQCAEYRDKNGRLVSAADARAVDASIWVYQRDNWTIMSSETKQSASIKNPADPNYRFYDIPHPLTGKGCKPSTRGWKGTRSIDPEHPERNSCESMLADSRLSFGPDETTVPRQKRFLHEVDTNVCKSVFADYSDGEKELVNLFNRSGLFLAPKHTQFVSRFLEQAVHESGVVLDCFGGSGSTSHAVLRINRAENWQLKYLTVEMGAHFETLIINRLKKVVYAPEWRKGKPQTRDAGISHTFKIARLESYEDALNNLHLRRTPEQVAALAKGGETNRDDYLLGYFLDVESAGSKSLLDLAEFRDPFAYKLAIATSSAGETKETTVDLVETFNWLLGLKVKHIDTAKGFLTVTGEKRAGGRCLILWRTLTAAPKADNAALEKFLTKLAVNPADTEFEFIYVNGPHTLNDPHNKVHLIEETFQRLMFDTKNFESVS